MTTLRQTVKDLIETNGGEITIRTFRKEAVENEEWKVDVTENDTTLFGVFTNSGASLQAVQEPSKLSDRSSSCLISPIDISDIEIGDLVIDGDDREFTIKGLRFVNPQGNSSEALLYVLEL